MIEIHLHMDTLIFVSDGDNEFEFETNKELHF